MLPGHHAQPGLGGDGDGGGAAVGDFVRVHLGGLGRRITQCRLQAVAVDHAAGGDALGFEYSGLVVDGTGVGLGGADVPGQGHGAVGGSGLAEGSGQGLQLLLQGHACAVVARRVALGGAVLQPVAADEPALACAQRPIRIGAQLRTRASEAAPVVVGGVQQVAQVEFGGGLGGFELNPSLGACTVAVVHDQLVVALAPVFFAADAPLGGGVVLAVGPGAGGGPVPHRAVAAGARADAVALGAAAVVGGLCEDLGFVVGFFVAGLQSTRRGQHPAFALAVVQRGQHDGAVDVAFQELHQHFLADAGDELVAHAATGTALYHPHPAGCIRIPMRVTLQVLRLALEVQLDADAAQAVGEEFLVGAGIHFSIRSDHGGAEAALGSRARAVVQPGAVGQYGPPGRGVGADGQGVEAVGVAAGPGLGEDVVQAEQLQRGAIQCVAGGAGGIGAGGRFGL